MQARFDSSSEESKERFDIVKNRMQHQFIKKYEIRSKYRWDDYDNVFRQHIWKFKSNYRKDTRQGYYASDVAKYQYSLIADKEGFFGYLPSIVKRSRVVNDITLKKTESLESGTQQMLQVFLTETPNGRSTQKILDDFGLKAIKVERINHNKKVDFLVRVVPASKDLTHSVDPAEIESALAVDSLIPSEPLPVKESQIDAFNNTINTLRCALELNISRQDLNAAP